MDAAPKRTLRVVSPYAHGEDVRRLQVALGVTEDGQYGPRTAHAAKVRALKLGAATSHVNAGLTEHAQTLIRTRKQTVVEKFRAKQRAKAAAKRAATHGRGGEGVAAAALKICRENPQREDPPGDNRGPVIDQWERGVDMKGLAWCGAFTHAIVKLVTGIDLNHAMRSCPAMEAMAHAGTGGFSEFIPASRIHEVPVGAILTWGRGEADHQSFLVEKVPVGATKVHDAGGNTSSGDGSQSDGGMTADKWRPIEGVFPLRGACVWRGI